MSGTDVVIDVAPAQEGGERDRQRIPKALQEVFVISNKGGEVDQPPSDGEASKVYLRNWIHQSKAGSARSTTSLSFRKSKSLFGESQEKIKCFASNIPEPTVVPREKRRLSFRERAKISPQALLDEHLQARGYSIETYNTLHTAYYSPPTESQKASYGPYMVRLIKEGNVQGMKEALDAGMSPNPCNQFGESLLHMACRRGNVEMLNVMLDHGASVQVVDDYGRTPLHDACWAAEPAFEVVKAILERDNRLFYMKDCRGSLPLSYVHRDHFAAWEDFLGQECIDRYFPVIQDGSGDEAPELCKLWPNARPLPDPKNSMPIQWAKMVAEAKMTVEEARIMVGGDDAVSTAEENDSASDSEEEEPDSEYDSDYDSGSEEDDLLDEEILQLAQSIRTMG